MNFKKYMIKKFGVFDENDNLDKVATLHAVATACDYYIENVEKHLEAERAFVRQSLNNLFDDTDQEYVTTEAVVTMVAKAVIACNPGLFNDYDFEHLCELTQSVIQCQIHKGEMVAKRGVGVARARK